MAHQDQYFTVPTMTGPVDVKMTALRGGKHKIDVRHRTAIPRTFLDGLAEQRKAGGRAPMGDSHGAYQKVAEIPLSVLFAKLPHDAWQDQKALARLLNDPDMRAFRTDGDLRRF